MNLVAVCLLVVGAVLLWAGIALYITQRRTAGLVAVVLGILIGGIPFLLTLLETSAR